MNGRTALALVALAVAAAASAQERPAEDDLFGAPAAPPSDPAAALPPAEPAVEPGRPEAGRDDAILGAPARGAAGAPTGVMTAAQENPLTVGGQLYLRSSATWLQSEPAAEWPLSTPNLLDLYLDARPNDRVRAFALARASWNPVATAAFAPGPADGTEPRVVLDQLWVNFDVARRVFVTVGKQHVKWGVGRFWNPTDFLHPVRRNPLAVFDDRSGATMVKLHVPWEAKGWNFYGVALLDDPAGEEDAASTVGKVAGGARAELVFGSAELGADALVRRGQRPRFGLDFSAGVWDLDVHGEVALRTSSDVTLWKEIDPSPTTDITRRYGVRKLEGVTPQAVLGVSYAVNYSDEDAVRFGAEYFYNGAGYDDAHIYPWLMVEPAWFGEVADTVGRSILEGTGNVKNSDFRSFYVGRHYAGAFVFLAAPGSWNDHSLTLNAIVNASDGSAVIRLDHSVLVNTYLTVESFVAGNVGNEGGEFRFSLDIPSQTIGGIPLTDEIVVPPPVMSAGVNLRVKL